MSVRIFIHGLESGNQGTKSIYFRERYPDMIIPNFTGDLPERMEKLKGVLSGKSNIRIVGSSFGGLMASLYAMEKSTEVDKMTLLAPAINLAAFGPYKGKTISLPVCIYHGKDDTVIPVEDVEPVARQTFTNLCFHKVDDDHFLHKTFRNIDWDSQLG